MIKKKVTIKMNYSGKPRLFVRVCEVNAIHFCKKKTKKTQTPKKTKKKSRFILFHLFTF